MKKNDEKKEEKYFENKKKDKWTTEKLMANKWQRLSWKLGL